MSRPIGWPVLDCRWAPRTPSPLGSAVAWMATCSALAIVAAILLREWRVVIWAFNSFGMSAVAWYALEQAAAAEARLAERRVDLHIDVPLDSQVIVQHRSTGPAALAIGDGAAQVLP